MTVVDQNSDTAFGVLYRQITRMPALETFLKQASIEPEEAHTLAKTAFAWPDERKFPIHTPAQAALSYAYAKTAEHLPSGVMSRITQALEVFAVPETTFTEQTEKIAADDVYVLPEFKYLPVHTEIQVKMAQDQLVRELSKLDLEHRATACANLVKRADELKVALRPEIMKLAGLVVSSTKYAREWIEARAAKLPADDVLHKTAYLSLADGLGSMPEEVSDRAGLLKLAATVAHLDEKTGLDKHYDRRLPDALQTVFNTDKLASASVDLGGRHVSIAKLAQLPASFWEDLGGKELSDEIAPGGVVDQSKLATIVDTLPLDLKTILRAQCR